MGILKTFFKVYKQESPLSKIRIIVRTGRYVIEKYLFRLHYSTYKVCGSKMKLDLSDNGIARTLAIFGIREKEHLYILKHELEPYDNILDLGANIGYYSLLMNKLKNNVKIIAVEPEPKNFDNLLYNISLNKCHNISAYKLGISDNDSIENLYISKLSNVHTFLPNDVKNHMSGNTIFVETMSLYNFILKINTKVNLIRMDIEGFETRVLSSLIKVVRYKISEPSVLFELHPDKYTHNNAINPKLKELFKLGYKFKILASSNKELFKQYGYDPIAKILTDGTIRYVFYNIKNKDALKLLKVSRTAFLTPKWNV